ncbi:hypothetical protein N7532_010038 [Penicillium argentinense]|uniref:Uncharacterized protein n=1 Tax=Penicillium argentinense TaxID=1131581 RepID=A0A9W9ENX0_9EURO|nr:uncharacterized protein N7532_010038 [Penicillium argentinense]KAJ5085267.1 hypothetical protein N7532_010038 [Penicillium argentinense]
MAPAAEDQQSQSRDINSGQRAGRAQSPAQGNQTQTPSYKFARTQEPLQFNATGNFNRSTCGIDFQPTTAAAIIDTAKSLSKTEKARARMAKAREEKAKKRSEKGGQSRLTESMESAAKRRSSRINKLVKGANHDREQSELSSEVDEFNMEELERQFRQDQFSSLPGERYSDRDFQPSSTLPERTGKVSRKRKQPHSDSISLSIRPSGQWKTLRRKPATSNRQ